MKRRLKIAQVVPFYYPVIGGAEKIVQDLSEEMVKRGHEVHVFTSSRNHAKKVMNRPSKEYINGVAVYRFSSLINSEFMSFFPGVILPLLEKRFDIVHLHAYRHPHTEIGNLISKLKFIPTILQGHSPFFPQKFVGPKYIFYGAYDMIARYTILKTISVILALTPSAKQEYIKRGAQKDKIKIVPNFVSKDFFRQDVDPSSFIQKYDLVDRKIMLFLSRLHPCKRVDLIITALPQVAQEFPNIFLLLVGPDENHYSYLANLARRLGVQSYFRWIGTLHGFERLRAYSACHFLVLPSDYEPFGIVLLEAMAMGKPVIAVDSGPQRYIVKDGETGLLIQPGDFSQLSKAMVTLLGDEDLRKRMGRNAREWAENFRLSKIVDKIEGIYKDLVTQRSRYRGH